MSLIGCLSQILKYNVIIFDGRAGVYITHWAITDFEKHIQTENPQILLCIISLANARLILQSNCISTVISGKTSCSNRS